MSNHCKDCKHRKVSETSNLSHFRSLVGYEAYKDFPDHPRHTYKKCTNPKVFHEDAGDFIPDGVSLNDAERMSADMETGPEFGCLPYAEVTS